MPRRTRRQIVGKHEAHEREMREQQVVLLTSSLHTLWLTNRKESR